MPRILNKSEREIHTTVQERTQKHFAPFLFAHTSVREKENTNPTMTQEQTRQARGQAEDKRTSKEGRKRDKSRSKEDKKKGKHATSPKPA